MPPAASIPRFLLPQGGKIWRTRLPIPSSLPLAIRNASKKAPPNKSSKPIVLEKPTKFNPPSHGRRLRTAPINYPGPQLSPEHKAAQKTKKYPNMMPPEGTFMHWLLNNRTIHTYITLGTLFSLAITVWITNFKRNSPFTDMLPSWGNAIVHPIDSFGIFWEVVKLTTDHNTAETLEKRKRKMDDVAKRAKYRQAHGLDQNQGFGGWTSKDVLPEDASPSVAVDTQSPMSNDEEVSPVEEVRRERRQPVKKWFGIW